MLHGTSSDDCVKDALLLIAEHGDEAVVEAAYKADQYQNAGDLWQYCRWRQVEKAITLFQLEDVIGEIH